jgi:hypothetical protein
MTSSAGQDDCFTSENTFAKAKPLSLHTSKRKSHTHAAAAAASTGEKGTDSEHESDATARCPKKHKASAQSAAPAAQQQHLLLAGSEPESELRFVPQQQRSGPYATVQQDNAHERTSRVTVLWQQHRNRLYDFMSYCTAEVRKLPDAATAESAATLQRREELQQYQKHGSDLLLFVMKCIDGTVIPSAVQISNVEKRLLVFKTRLQHHQQQHSSFRLQQYASLSALDLKAVTLLLKLRRSGCASTPTSRYVSVHILHCCTL